MYECLVSKIAKGNTKSQPLIAFSVTELKSFLLEKKVELKLAVTFTVLLKPMSKFVLFQKSVLFSDCTLCCRN